MLSGLRSLCSFSVYFQSYSLGWCSSLRLATAWKELSPWAPTSSCWSAALMSLQSRTKRRSITRIRSSHSRSSPWCWGGWFWQAPPWRWSPSHAQVFFKAFSFRWTWPQWSCFLWDGSLWRPLRSCPFQAVWNDRRRSLRSLFTYSAWELKPLYLPIQLININSIICNLNKLN
jgi:hypothetical protein